MDISSILALTSTVLDLFSDEMDEQRTGADFFISRYLVQRQTSDERSSSNDATFKVRSVFVGL